MKREGRKCVICGEPAAHGIRAGDLCCRHYDEWRKAHFGVWYERLQLQQDHTECIKQLEMEGVAA